MVEVVSAESGQRVYKQFLNTPVLRREGIWPADKIPIAWKQLDAWMRPKLIEASPEDVKEWVNQKAQQGIIDESHVILFHLMKLMAPGGPEEKVQLLNRINNPAVCSQPKAAQLELTKWKEPQKV